MRTIELRQPPWMAYAWADLGQREVSGAGSNPHILEYFRRCGHPEVSGDATAWCAAFVGACLDRAGIAGTHSLLARSYLDWGGEPDAADPGAVVVLSRSDDPSLGHVGFLVGVTDEHVVVLGGNQSNAVSVEAFSRARLVGIRVPAGNAAPEADSAVEETFAWSLARVLDLEGGYDDDPFDPGGPTNKGITLTEYASFLGATLAADTYDDLKGRLRIIPDDVVARIYRERYWRPARAPDLPAGLAHFHFDAAVNQGIGGATRMLQEALGVEVDGEIGPLTLAATSALPVPGVLERYAAIRRRRYRSLKTFWRFGRGWLARVDTVLAQASGLAATGAPAAPSSSNKETKPMTDPMTFPTSAQAPVTKWWGNSMTVWGALITGATTVAPAVLAAFGLDVPAPMVEQLSGHIIAVVQAVGGLAGTVMTITGRARAAAPLARRPLQIHL